MHQLARPNFSFVPVLRRSNPGCAITLLTDQATQFAGLPAGVHVFRTRMDRARLGRNAWANYYQFRAQQVPALTAHPGCCLPCDCLRPVALLKIEGYKVTAAAWRCPSTRICTLQSQLRRLLEAG